MDTPIRTPDQRLRVFVSSTIGELAPERAAVRDAVEQLHLVPVLFEMGARPHPPRELYRAYLAHSDIFIGVYWQRYGWVAPDQEISGLEDELRLAGDRPRLLYIKEPAPQREPRLQALLADIKSAGEASYQRFATPDELAALVRRDLAVLLSERFAAAAPASPEAAGPPVPLTPTVGRERETAAVTALLQAGQRLVTLTGPGGIGKTRLALEVARAVGDAYPDGVRFVPLAAVADPALVLPTVAERLGVRTEGHRDLVEAVAAHLGGARTLLLLDNLEQVATAGADITALLERSPGLQVLATSRQALRLQAETVVPVAPLPLPPEDAPAAVLQAEPAVRLFAQRAQAAAPGFTMDPDTAAAVATLCRRLDGLPLAIELAAARARLLPPRLLLQRLDDGGALAAGGPDLPERQRTLRRTLDWSHALLNAREQALFARLSVFPGGCSLAAVEAVCGTGDHDVLETLASLLDKSLVTVAEEAAADGPRVRMLETIRRYAAARLEERGERQELRRRHLGWFRRLAEEAQPFLCGVQQRQWAARLDPDRANVRAAAATALEDGDDVAVVELAWDVIVYYFIRDAVAEPESWLDAVAAAGRPLDPVTTAKLRSLRTLLRLFRGECADVHEPLESSLATFRAHGMDFEAAVTLKELAFVRFMLDGDSDAALALLGEAVRLFDGVGHDWGVALSETMRGTVLAAQAAWERSARHHRRALERARRIDNEPLVAQALQQLGMVQALRGDAVAAVPLLEEAAALLRRGRYRTDATYCLDALAAVALVRGDPDTAARAIAAAAAGRRRLGTAVWPTVQALVDRLALIACEQLGEARYAAAAAAATDEDLFAVLERTLAAVRVPARSTVAAAAG